jgi:hypothetical protein
MTTTVKDAIVYVQAKYPDRTEVVFYCGPEGGWHTDRDRAKQYTRRGADRVHTRLAKLLGLELLKHAGLPHENDTAKRLIVGWKVDC